MNCPEVFIALCHYLYKLYSRCDTLHELDYAHRLCSRVISLVLFLCHMPPNIFFPFFILNFSHLCVSVYYYDDVGIAGSNIAYVPTFFHI